MNNSAIIITAVTVVCLLLLVAGVVMSFRSARTAVVATFAGMLGIGLLTVDAKATELIFWGIATAIVVAIQYLLPANVTASRRGVGYIVGATLAGMSVGLTLGREWVTIGAAVGAILGGIAYSRTPDGRSIKFPSSKFLNYLCAKGLPTVVVMSMTGTVVMWLAENVG